MGVELTIKLHPVVGSLAVECRHVAPQLPSEDRIIILQFWLLSEQAAVDYNAVVLVAKWTSSSGLQCSILDDCNVTQPYCNESSLMRVS